MSVETVIEAARAFLGERITTNATLREHHSHGQDTQTPVLPDAVAFAETSDEVARVLRLCHTERVPVVAWGAGTSLEGHVTPVRGGITLDVSRMTRIIDVSQPDMDCRVEAGAVGEVGVLRISFLKTLQAVQGLWQFLEVSADLLTAAQVRLVVRRTLRQIADMAIPKRRQRSCPRALRQPVSGWPRLRKNTSKKGEIGYSVTEVHA